MKKLGTIYKIENLVNGKVYIGQTMKDVDRRIQCHLVKLRKNYHNNNYFQNAFNKYGEGNFKASIVEKCTIENIDNREKYWIRKYKDKKMAYNIEEGGNYIKEIPLETRRKLAISTKESWKNESIRNKRIAGLPKGSENYNSRAVICITDMKVFDTMTKAGEYYNISMKAIEQSVSGRNPYCYNEDRTSKLEFDYYEKGKLYKPQKHIHKLSMAVICITTGEKFDSVTQASNKYSVPTTNISKVCKKQRNYAGQLKDGTKLKWEYA